MADSHHIRYGLDRIVATGTRIFGWGWAAHPDLNVTGVHLRVQTASWQRRLQADFGLARRDVQDAFPYLRNATSAGFIVTGYVPEGGERRLTLEIDLEGGGRMDVDVTAALPVPQENSRRWRQFAYVVRALWRRIKRGDLGGILRRARAQTYAASTLDDQGVIEEIVPALRAARAAWLLFDHNMGGGANQYRRTFIGERVAAGEAVVFCTYNLPMLEYRLHLHAPRSQERVFRISSFLVLEAAFDACPALQVFVNSPVSFEDPLMLAEWLARMRTRHASTRLVMTTHDYFAACPSFVLLNADGRYCNVPDATECARCLSRHSATYVSLSPPTDVPAWRASWGRCLVAADEVRCFSDASREILRRAFPALAPDRITVLPHKVDFAPARSPRLDASTPMVIGVVGEITPQKGAGIVTGIAEILDREGRDARIVVIGALDAACRSSRVKATGPYRREQLVDLVEQHGINLFLFPSIWPETFSYVVAELMALHAPIVAFDLGAPAERLRHYALGRICTEVSPAAALAALTAFHSDLRRSARERVA